MQTRTLPTAIFALVFSAAAFPASPPPYAGQQSREIKSMSTQEVGDYLAGKGMGLAKAAELNGYPGPAHVIELAEQLALTTEQRAQTETLLKDMQTKAIAAGVTLVGEEKALDNLFATKNISPATLQGALNLAAERQARVRFIHLDAHLAQVTILSPRQIALYNELRGYADSAKQHVHQHAAH